MPHFDISGPALPEKPPRPNLIRLRHYERWILGCVLLGCVLIGVWLISAPSDFPKNTLVTIPQGTTAQGFASILKEEHIIRYAISFRIIAHLTTFDHRLDTGVYAFSKPESLPVVLWRIAHDEHGIAPVRVTITEGMASYDIVHVLQKSMPGFDAAAFLTDASTSEGYLFPETYFLMPGDPPDHIVSELRAQFASSTASLAPQIAASHHSERDIVIMASILEREAKTPQDMRIVAGILWNRIAQGMPLQVDAAFGYIHQQDGYTPTAADLSSDSLYNTYTHLGLPPTPISNPGLDALAAAADPAQTNYLYYLTGSDGTMYYATTYAEHQKNIAAHLK